MEVYKRMCELIYELDLYHHPISAHQLNTAAIGCLGNVPVSFSDGGYNDYDPLRNERTNRNNPSAFRDVKGHNWWAMQWRPAVDQQFNFDMPKDYYENSQGKPFVNYEARYDYLYTKEFGARAQAWISYLSVACGYAYGGADMWVYNRRFL